MDCILVVLVGTLIVLAIFSLDSFLDWQVDDIREDDEAAAEALEAAKKQEISKKQEKGGKAA